MRQELADATSNFIGRRHSLTLRQTPRWAHSFILILVFFGGVAVLASLIIRIDEVVTVRGQLRPTSGARDVLAPITATLGEVMVRDGELVTKGQVLGRYDTRDATIRAKNLEEQIKLTQKTLSERIELLKTDENSLRRTQAFTRDVADRYKFLSEQGATSDLSYVSQKKQLEDVNSQIIRLGQQRVQVELEQKQRLQSLRSELSQVRLLLANGILRAPVSGKVFELKKSGGQVTTMGERLLQLVPQNAAKAEVFVGNQDIGFVRVGQMANVRIDAYPYTKFGELKGKVVKIGADALEPSSNNPTYRFPVEIGLGTSSMRTGGMELDLKPGMAVQANLRLRDKPVISLLTDMFTKNFDGLKSLRN